MNKLVELFRDTTARKPSGWLGRHLYQNPKAHNQSFTLVLEKLKASKDDIFLEVACGGGVLLQKTLSTVKQAAAIDHSCDMVLLAREKNREAVEKGIVEIIEGDAASLPWLDANFTCVACANAFFFLENPYRVLSEMYRVLKPGGRLVIVTMGKQKTPVSMAFVIPYGLKIYSDDMMLKMLLTSGFIKVEVCTKHGLQSVLAWK